MNWIVQPGGRVVKVRGVQVHGKPSAEAVAGQRTAINLGGVDIGDVSRGETLLAADTLSVTRRVDTEIDLLPTAKPLRHGARVRLHNGTSEVLGRVSIAGASTSAKAAADKSSDEVAPGDTALVRVRLESPGRADARRSIHHPRVFTADDDWRRCRAGPRADTAGHPVRERARESRSLANGRRRHRRHSVAHRQRGTGGHRHGVACLTDGRAAVATGGDGAKGSRRAAPLSFTIAWSMPGICSSAQAEVLKLVTAAHKANPMSDGLPREEARGKAFAKVAPAIFERVIDDLKAARALVGAERLALPTHKATVAGADDHVRSAIISAYRVGGLKPPDAAAVETTVKAPRAIIEKVTTLLLREKVLVKLDTIVFHGDALQVLKEEVAALKGSAPGGRATVDVAAFKDRYGVSRKFAIPLLEYLDRERVTRRTGDVRLVL